MLIICGSKLMNSKENTSLKEKNQKIYVTRGYGKFQVCQPGNAAMTNSSQLHAACPFSLQIKVLRVKTEI